MHNTLYLKTVQFFAVSLCTWLSAQEYEPTTKSFESGIGIRVAVAQGQFMDFVGGKKHYAPLMGVDFHSRYNFESPKIAIRGKVSYDNSGDRQLGESEYRSEVKRSMATLGLMIFSPRGRPGYICIESGLVYLDITSTFAPLADFTTNKNMTRILVGAETRRFYFEIGWEFFGFVNKNMSTAENNYIYRGSSMGHSVITSIGIKFP